MSKPAETKFKHFNLHTVYTTDHRSFDFYGELRPLPSSLVSAISSMFSSFLLCTSFGVNTSVSR